MSEIVHIDINYVVQGVKRAAAERPGVYERRDGGLGCANIEIVDGKPVPSCIVGHILSAAVGVENVEASGSAHSTLWRLQSAGLITYTPEAEHLLRVIQVFQDTKTVPWNAIAEVMDDLVSAAMRLVLCADRSETKGHLHE